MTAFLDWISQHVTTAPLWIQSPIVILGSVLVCTVLAVILLRGVDIIGAWVQKIGPSKSSADSSGKGEKP